MNRKLTYKITGLSILLIGVSFIAWGLHGKFSRPKPAKSTVKIKDNTSAPVADPILLSRYEAIFKKYDTLKRNLTMSGTINIVDQADTSANMKHVGFLFCKTGDNFYYKLGTTETINARGLYIYIDHLGQTIIVAPQKKVAYDVQPNAFADLGNEIRTEGYNVTATTNGDMQTLYLHNEHNINCKLFSISYDTTALNIRHMHARMTNLQDPSRKDNEKLIDISITEWNAGADLNKFYKEDIVIKVNGKWKATDKYKNYQLTTME